MLDVGVAPFFVAEGDQKAVRQTFGLVLFADVGAVLQADDRVDLARQSGKGVDDFLDLLGCLVVFELVEHDMPQHFGPFVGRAACG